MAPLEIAMEEDWLMFPRDPFVPLVPIWRTPLPTMVWPKKLPLFPVRMVVPLPSWLMEPVDPWMEEARVAVLLWLKLRVPVPAPSKIVEAEMVPPASLDLNPPIFRVPADPVTLPRVIVSEITEPPCATVRAPEPVSPTIRPPVLLQSEPPPVTRTELLEPA